MGFREDIITAAKDAGTGSGLYIGCGNGRNYIPLTEAGLNLIGLDISATAISQLADRLITGDLTALSAGQRFPLLVAIQVMQHGTRAQTHDLLAVALAIVARGGLFAIRVNAIGTDVHHRHEVTERDSDGSFSVRYADGPKTGMTVHFWAARELESAVTGDGFAPVLTLRPQATWLAERAAGLWLQWDGICRRAA